MADLSPDEVRLIVETAYRAKREGYPSELKGKILALLFEKPSLRTRVSFEVAMRRLGGDCIYLSPQEVGLGSREPIADVARVLERYVDIIAARTFAHSSVEELARYASIPVINALSDGEHPCQALGDLLTIYEHKGRWQGIRLAFVGDGNNVAASLALASAMVGMHFVIASPAGYEIPQTVVHKARSLAATSGGGVELVRDPLEAARGADVLYTDVWTSMGQESEQAQRRQAFAGYQVNAALMAVASSEVIIMHDLPAHHGEEITDDAFESPRSVIFDQAENRLHAQQALIFHLLSDSLP